MESNPYATPAANLFGATSGIGGDTVSPETLAHLAGTKPWVRFISVMMWIGVAIMLLIALAIGGMMALGLSNSNSGPFGVVGMILFAAMYGVMAFLYIFPAVKLWKYANRIGSLSSTRSVADLDAALNEQRGFWKFIGVMMIVMICIYAVVIIAGGAAGVIGAMKAGVIPGLTHEMSK